MRNNEEFLNVIKESFKIYLETGTSRSPEKLKPLHGCIAKDIAELLGNKYSIKSMGYGDGREATIQGAYNSKNVDIGISKNNKYVGAFAVKFIMRNYAQNTNNYFENMLGETANIRTAGIPYFQIFIIFDKVPYFNKDGRLKRYKEITDSNLKKYIALSRDDPKKNRHTPDKTLLIIIKLKNLGADINVEYSQDYNRSYLQIINDIDLLLYSNDITMDLQNSVILNNYEIFMNECANILKNVK